jgi:hypothetical protein
MNHLLKKVWSAYRELANAIFVKIADPPSTNWPRYRRKQPIQTPVIIGFVYTNTFIRGGTGNKSLKSTSELEFLYGGTGEYRGARENNLPTRTSIFLGISV